LFNFLGSFIGRYPRHIVWLGLLLVALAAVWQRDLSQHLVLAPGWDAPASGSAMAQRWLREQLDHDETPVIILFRSRQAQHDPVAFREAVEKSLASIGRDPDVRALRSAFSSGDPLMLSVDGRQTYAVVSLARGEDEGVGAFQHLRSLLLDPAGEPVAGRAVEISLGGELATYVEIHDRISADVLQAEVISFAVLALLLVWVFGSLAAALLPLITGLTCMLLAFALLKFCAGFLPVSVYAVNVVSMLGLGLAIDYSLFMVSRFREELAADNPRALCATLQSAGRTVVYSGLTVASSLLCLNLLPQRFFHDMGLAGAIAVATAMLAAILLLPAALHLLGPRVNAWSVPWLARRARQLAEGGWWSRMGRFVMRHAYGLLPVSLLLLAVLAWPFAQLSIGPADSRVLPIGSESRMVEETLQNDFPPADLLPLLVVVRAEGPVTALGALAGIDALTRGIAALPGVTEVKGLTSVDAKLTLADYQLLYRYPEQFPLAGSTLAAFSRGHYSLLYVNYNPVPTSEAARTLAAQIRALPVPAGLAEMQVGGYPAFNLDYIEALQQGVPWVLAAILAINLLILFLMLGSVVLPIKAVLANLISMSATFGVLVWVFQAGHFAGWLGFTPQVNLDGTLLVLIFAIAFGLAIDYEMFLLARIREAHLAGIEQEAAIAEGVRRSGPVITGAAFLIAAVLVAFATGGVVSMKAMAIGLLVSVLVDATLVRMLLVPSALRLLGPLAWWAPAWLHGVHRRFGWSEVNE
jgi:RND superfamily putative drug exporter